MRRLTDLMKLNNESRFYRWLKRLFVVFLVLLIPNFIYAGLLYMPTPHEVIPAKSIDVAEHFILGGEREQNIKHVAAVMYEEITHYINYQRNEGDLLHSTTLGIFNNDSATAEYVMAHMNPLQDPGVAVLAENAAKIDIVSIVHYDLKEAMQLYASGLESRNPLRMRKIIKAQQMLREINLILTARVGERGHGNTMTYKFITADR